VVSPVKAHWTQVARNQMILVACLTACELYGKEDVDIAPIDVLFESKTG